jgi:hypothetical protein
MKISKKTLFTSLIASSVLVSVLLFTYNYDKFNTNADESIAPPGFPICAELTGNGDWVHSDYGFHHLPGQEATLEGSDDVYFLNQGDFVQCLCGIDGAGHQTNWWKIDDKLTQDEVNNYIEAGWYFENGSEWNLLNTQYLALNSTYDCSEPTPTPTVTPSATPTATPSPTPTATATPTPTPTDDGDDEPRCTGLSANPDSGSSPLTVRFNASGFDPNGDILEYEFDFGDSSGFQPKVWKTEDSEAAHRYENSGSYIATVRVKDQGGRWRGGNDECRIEINVDGTPQVLSASTAKTLPATGSSATIAGGLVLAGIVGRLLYKRFKLI